MAFRMFTIDDFSHNHTLQLGNGSVVSLRVLADLSPTQQPRLKKNWGHNTKAQALPITNALMKSVCPDEWHCGDLKRGHGGSDNVDGH